LTAYRVVAAVDFAGLGPIFLLITTGLFRIVSDLLEIRRSILTVPQFQLCGGERYNSIRDTSIRRATPGEKASLAVPTGEISWLISTVERVPLMIAPDLHPKSLPVSLSFEINMCRGFFTRAESNTSLS
jgi:hypothetical protein